MSESAQTPESSGPDDNPPAADHKRTRREVLAGGAFIVGGAIGAGVTYGAVSGGGSTTTTTATTPTPTTAVHASASQQLPLRAFTSAQAETVTAMAERIFPKDASGPGATDAGVMSYIDGQLAGGWGHGEREYRQGPFYEPSDYGHGYQLPLTPLGVYEIALAKIDDYATKHYKAGFSSLKPNQQDEVLTALENGKVDLGLNNSQYGFTSADFFSMFLENVTEGLFADPMYGGNRDMVGWKWIGFPGDPMAYGDRYAELFSKWHQPYHPAPKPLQATAAQ